MSSYMIRGVPPGLIQRAKAQARAREEKLDDVLIHAMQEYAEGTDRTQTGERAGKARAAALSENERSAIARKAAETRWKDRK